MSTGFVVQAETCGTALSALKAMAAQYGERSLGFRNPSVAASHAALAAHYAFAAMALDAAPHIYEWKERA